MREFVWELTVAPVVRESAWVWLGSYPGALEAGVGLAHCVGDRGGRAAAMLGTASVCMVSGRGMCGCFLWQGCVPSV